MFQDTKLYLHVSFSKISASALFLKYSQNFTNFSLDILIKYIIKKECMCQEAHQASTDKNNSTKTSETISDSAECYAGLSVRFESSAACM